MPEDSIEVSVRMADRGEVGYRMVSASISSREGSAVRRAGRVHDRRRPGHARLGRRPASARSIRMSGASPR